VLGTAVYVALEAEVRLFGDHPFPSNLWIALAVVVLGVILTAVRAIAAAPDTVTLARVSEQRFTLQERLSSAIEVCTWPSSDTVVSPVHAALIADAERRVASVEPRSMIPVALPRAAWAIPALAAVLGLLQLVPPDPFGLAGMRVSGADVEASTGEYDSGQRTEMAESLRRIADLMGQEADERADPYLRAVARTLDRLSTDVQHGDVDRAATASELERLLQHTRDAYARSDRDLSRSSVADMLQSALNVASGNQRQTPQAMRDPAAAQARSSADADAPARPDERRSSPVRPPASPGGFVPDQLSAQAMQQDAGEYGIGELDERSQRERALAEQQRASRPAGAPAGAASNAGKGEGDQAGDGAHPLEDGDSKDLTALRRAGEMVLPDQTAREGGRIRIELPPDAERSAVAAQAAASGEWRRTQEAQVQRDEFAADARRVVGKYFGHSESKP
jgi:hypothetical protein